MDGKLQKAIDHGLIRKNRETFQVQRDFLGHRPEVSWENVKNAWQRQLEDAYASGDLDEAPSGVVRFR